jgi:hypothetical protein
MAGKAEKIIKRQQLDNGLMEYLKRPDFPLRLFKKQYLEARQKVLLQQAMGRMAED